MTRSEKFLFTCNHSTDAGADRITIARELVRSANSQAREIGSPNRWRINVVPRKGKNNPNAWKYDNPQMRGKPWRMEDYERVDVYMIVETHETRI